MVERRAYSRPGRLHSGDNAIAKFQVSELRVLVSDKLQLVWCYDKLKFVGPFFLETDPLPGMLFGSY